MLYMIIFIIQYETDTMRKMSIMNGRNCLAVFAPIMTTTMRLTESDRRLKFGNSWGTDQSLVGEINLTHKLPRGLHRALWARGWFYLMGDGEVCDVESVRKRERSRDGLDVARIKISLHLRRVGEGGHRTAGESEGRG